MMRINLYSSILLRLNWKLPFNTIISFNTFNNQLAWPVFFLTQNYTTAILAEIVNFLTINWIINLKNDNIYIPNLSLSDRLLKDFVCLCWKKWQWLLHHSCLCLFTWKSYKVVKIFCAYLDGLGWKNFVLPWNQCNYILKVPTW